MIQVDAEVMRSGTSGYTVKFYVPVPKMASMEKFYFTDESKTRAISKARAFAKERGYKLKVMV